MTLPTIGFGTIPWWVWNGHMNYAEIERQLVLMKDASMQGWTLWARFGLEVEYLGHEFMQRFQFAVQKSAQLGLDVWVFDEFAWPTCSANSKAPEVDPAYRMRVLSCFARDVEGSGEFTFSPDWGKSGFITPDAPTTAGTGEAPWPDPSAQRRPISPYLFTETTEQGNRRVFAPRLERAVAVPVIDGRMRVEQTSDITAFCDDLSLRWTPPAITGGGAWRVLMLISRDFGLNIDVLNPDAVRCFIDLTHKKYKAYVGEYFGSTFKGFFSDETRMIRNTQHRFIEPTIPWSVDLFDRLEQRGLEDLDACLAAVFADHDEPSVTQRRLAFSERLTDIYAQSFYEQLCHWANENGVIYTGDCFSEDGAVLGSMGDYFKMVRPYHVPGLDALLLPEHQSREAFKSPKFASSVAHQNEGLGAGRCLCEGPGLLGWGATIEQMKHVTDWMYVFGVNLLVPNAMHYSIAHEQLYETPSYFFQWTLWPFYPDWDKYTANLGRALTRGVHRAPVAYYYPTETLLGLYRPMEPGRCAMFIKDDMAAVYPIVAETAYELIHRQIDFDYVDRGALARASVNNGQLELAGETFALVLVPAARIIARSSAEKLRQFAQAGGKILWIRPLPTHYDDGEDASALAQWIESSPQACTVLDGIPDHLIDQIQDKTHRGDETLPEGYADQVESTITRQIELPIRLESARRSDFAVHQRCDGDDDSLFVVFFGDESTTAQLALPGWSAAEQVDLLTGQRVSIDATDGCFQLHFAPYESKLLARTSAPPAPRATSSTLTLDGPWTVTLPDHNLIVAEPVTVETEWSDRRSWEARLMYRLGFTLHVDGALESAWWVMDEVQHYVQWDRLKVLVNDQQAACGPSPIIDPTLIAADLAEHLQIGENHVVLELDQTDYMNSANLFAKRRAPAPVVRPRVLGSFAVAEGRLAPMPASLTVTAGEDLAQKGFGLYSGRVLYRKTITTDADTTVRTVTFENLAHHAVVRVNATEIGRTLWRPWRINCKLPLAAGKHVIEIEVTNTQANQMFEEPRPFGLLGPVKLGFEE